MQGIGFRPYICRLAEAYQLNGWVNNSADGVHIEVNASDEKANGFYKALLKEPPRLASITHHSMEKVAQKDYAGFRIISSTGNITPDVLLAPDYALCAHCKKELHTKSDRRFQYAFITCTQCGPRYSIIKVLPYDRESTAMHPFTMCWFCRSEYDDVNDNRFFSQTNSCPGCGIALQLLTAGGERLPVPQQEMPALIGEYLAAGKTVAVKGTGGYVLLCDATNAGAIQQLRDRKCRPAKPFALLFKDIQQVRAHAELGPEEQECLCSAVAPIVLLRGKPHSGLAVNEIAPALNRIGCMLPNAPLLDIIATTFNRPLICTSANVSNSAILYKDEDTLLYLPQLADYIITHNREILIPQDDSVVQFTALFKQQVVLRRSRGMAPGYFGYKQKHTGTLLATGALMKSSFTLQTNNKTYISQYLGSTGGMEAQENYKDVLAHMQQVLQVSPRQVIADLHPEYFSTQLAGEMSLISKIAVKNVQHHKAHFAAILAENNLLESEVPVLGVIWDGAGLGTDVQVWGSEFFRFENNVMLRCCHFDYFPQLLNDKMAREPRLSAYSICNEIPGATDLLQNKFTAAEWALYGKMLQNVASVNCCSMGRIFDAVAALLNLCDKQSYEGEAALYLQNLAESYTECNGYSIGESYFSDEDRYCSIPTITLFTGIVQDIVDKREAGFIAAKFHFSLVHSIEMIAGQNGIENIAFSGGVFQNSLLVDMIIQLLDTKFNLLFHRRLSPNDENISFGQMVYADNDIDDVFIKGSTVTELQDQSEYIQD